MFCCLYVCCAQAYHRNRVQHGAALGGALQGRQLTEHERRANLHLGGVAGYGQQGRPVMIEMHAMGGPAQSFAVTNVHGHNVVIRTASGQHLAPGPALTSQPMVVGYGGDNHHHNAIGGIRRTLSGSRSFQPAPPAAIPMAQPFDDDGSAALPFAGEAVAVPVGQSRPAEPLRGSG